MMSPHSTRDHQPRSAGLADPESDAERTARFEGQVIPLRNRLYSRAFRLTRNQQDAEDLVQDTILRAYAGFRTFRDGTQLMAWLYRIMHNTWINHWRKQQRSAAEVPLGHITDDELSALAARNSVWLRSAESTALEALPDNEIKAALLALEETFRLTIYYADVEGFSNREIAYLMNTPVGTVMSRLHRGRRRLRISLSLVAGDRGYGLHTARDNLREAR
jgi:RNA polymerase sigma-70 factor, ECF subfamily